MCVMSVMYGKCSTWRSSASTAFVGGPHALVQARQHLHRLHADANALRICRMEHFVSHLTWHSEAQCAMHPANGLALEGCA